MAHETEEVNTDIEEAAGKLEDEEVHGGHGKGGHGKKPKSAASNILELFVDPLIAYIRKSTVRTSRFVTFLIGLFFLGSLFGFFLPQFAERISMSAGLLLLVPLILAVLAFLPAFTDMVVIIFILLLLALLFLLI